MTTGGRMAGGSGEDEVLSSLFKQVTDLQAARFSAGYDFEAGADRFQTWLRQPRQQDRAAADPIRGEDVPARQVSPARLSAAAVLPMPGDAAMALRITSWSAGIKDELAVGLAQPGPDRALTALFNKHYTSLVRLAALLVGDIATAEQIVQDSFVAVHHTSRQPDSDSVLSFLRQAVLARSRATMRHRTLAGGNAADTRPGRTGAEQHAVTSREYQTIIAALRMLPLRQREVIVLRFYADLSEAEIAAVMAISKSAVRSHIARATSSLRADLEDWHQ
jgi:RNA polymerase sigma factor (sigma-70 family)